MKRQVASLTRIASLSLFVAASPVHALDLMADSYFVASFGQSNIIETPMQVDNNAILSRSEWNVRNLQSTQTSSNAAWKLQLGYALTPRLAIEGGYVDLGKTTYNSTYNWYHSFVLPLPFIVIGGQSEAIRGSSTRVSRITGWNVAGVGTYHLNDKLAAFGKLGVIRASIRSRDSGGGFFAVGSASDYQWRPTYGVGASYKYNQTFGVRAEIESFSKLGDAQTTGSTDVNLMTVGLTAKF